MPHIIVVDDEDDVREFLRRAFQRYAPHAEISAAADGPAALDLVRTHGCDLLITDHRMPGMTGAELLRTLREQGLDCPIIVISADASAESAAVDAGATAFFYKPLTTTQIRALIQTWLASPGDRAT